MLARFDVLLVVGFILFGGDVGDHVGVDVYERHLFEDVVGAASGRAVEGPDLAWR